MYCGAPIFRIECNDFIAQFRGFINDIAVDFPLELHICLDMAARPNNAREENVPVVLDNGLEHQSTLIDTV